MVSRAIEVGQSLLANQSEKLAERDRISERNRRKQKQQGYLMLAGGLLGNFATTDAAKKATAFFKSEPILAARTKFNLGVKNSIAAIGDHEKALAHSAGAREYYANHYLPEITASIKRKVDPREYTKQGLETFAYNRALEHADKVLPLHENAYQAALRVGQDKDAFNKFIKINDGIADSRLGAAAQTLTGLFKGQSQEALKTRMNAITNSKYVVDAENVNLALQAIQQANGKLTTEDGKLIAHQLQQHKMNDEDYKVTGEKPTVRTIGKANIPGKLVTKTNSHGHEKEVFIADKEFQDKGISHTIPTERIINGMVYEVLKTTVYTPQGEAYTYGTPRALRLADSPVNDAEAEIAFDSMLKASNVYSGLEEGRVYGTNPISVDIKDINGYIMQGVTNFGDDRDDEVAKERRLAFSRSLAEDANLITLNLANSDIKISRNDAAKIAEHIVFNDITRTSDESYNESLRRNGVYNPFLVLEAIGSLNESGSLKDGSILAKSITDSENFREFSFQINRSEQAKILRENFNVYQGEEAYEHLFAPSVELSKGTKVSVYDFLEALQNTKQDR